MKRIGVLRTGLCLLSAVLGVCALSPTAQQQFDVSEYVYGVDQDLQARARAAVEAERYAIQTKSWLQNRLGSDGVQCRTIPEKPCPPSMFRTPSGACNNIKHAAWGARSSPFLRFIAPAYADGVSSPRQSVTQHFLPDATSILSRIKSEREMIADHHEGLTSFTGLWAELLLRDIGLPVRPSFRANRCCEEGYKHEECYPSIDDSDVCHPYYRTVPTLSAHSCRFRNREQMNGASGYLDGGDIYGSTDEKLHRIRTYSEGRVDPSACGICNATSGSGLGQLYKAILREHNRIATSLSEFNSHWDDTKIFLEARRAVVAQLQHVTINEFIPSILGESAYTDPHLSPITRGFYDGYSSENRGGAYDAVVLAAMEALKSLQRESSEESYMNDLELHLTKSAKNVNLDYGTSTSEPNWDAASLLVHMARDQGVPGYIDFLSYCSNGANKVNDFQDLERFMSAQDARNLSLIYSRVEDIDLLVGGSLEASVEGKAVGPTFACLLREQFIKLRNSDRFWYENDLPPSGFTPEQLSAIRRISISGIICAHTSIPRIQPKAFIQQDLYLNARISCDTSSILDLTAWKAELTPVEVPDIDSEPPTTKKPDFLADLPKEIIEEAVKKARDNLVQRKQIEYNSWLEKKIADPKSPAGTAASFSKANKDALLLANSSILFELATNELLNGVHSYIRRRKRQAFDSGDNILSFPNSEFSDLLQNVDITGFLPHGKATNHEEVDCPVEDSACDPTSPYRTFTGHCNNLRNPSLGKSLTTFARLLPPVYEDGVSKPRVSASNGHPLPNPRVVSTVIHPDISNLHNRYTLMVMQFAQFLDHDLTMTPIHKGFAESIPSCRSCDSARTVHPECNPFAVPPGDHFFPTTNVTSGARLCFPSMRSLPGQQHLGPREQVNQNTAFLDASVVYGENNCIANVLRGFTGRMNITTFSKGKDLLPQSATHPECKAPSGFCFIGGDARASEQPALTVMHTMWVREHNRIMEGLRQVNPHWDPEKLYQQTRRLLSAMLQHITYNEFLPRILGWNAVSLYGLKLLPQGYYKEYSPTCNPSILNEFATAAYRIGHSLLRPHLPRMDRNYQPMDPPILLRDGFFNPDMLYQESMIDEMIRGLVATPMETMDQFITGEVTNHLFEQHAIPHSGIDLIALNVQRARDHGIPSYNNYRALCNLKRATTFEDLSREMTPEVIARMKRIYPSVDDIDLFPGGMSERPLQGGLVGPTFACIIAIQFRQARKCDRFWYETDDPNIRFTEHQLAEIRKNTLSKVICENMDSHVEMQRASFDLPSNFLNPRVPCGSMPHMDFSAWKETRHGCQIGGRSVALGESGFPTPCTSCVCGNEGTQCASLRITDCNQLMREASREAILRDDVCTAQCGFALAAAEASSRLQFTAQNAGFPNFPSLRGSLRGPTTPSTFNGFKLPDLSQFIG